MSAPRPTLEWFAFGLFALLALAYAWSRWSGPVGERPPDVAAWLKSGEFERAAIALERWLEDHPTNPDVELSRAEIFLGRGEAERALQVLDQLSDISDREQLRWTRLKGLSLAETGRGAEAEPLLLRLANAPNSADSSVFKALARILLQTYRLKPASVVLSRWAEVDPADPTPWLWMTEVDERLDVVGDLAIEHFRQALRREPGSVQIRLGLADSLSRANRLDEASRLYREVLDQDPENAQALLGAANIDADLGRLMEARAKLDRAVELNPNHAGSLGALAAILLANGDYDGALLRIDRALSVDPYDPENHYRRALALDRKGRLDDAEVARERAAKLRQEQAELRAVQRKFNENPRDDSLRLAIARWMIEHGQGPQGVRWAETILAHNPEHPGANRLLATYHEAQGNAGLANFYRLQEAKREETP